MKTVVPSLVLLALTIYALIDCLRTDDSVMKSLPKPFWFIVILLVPLIGPIAWLVAGKQPAAAPPPSSARRSGPLAPDDDPAFLKKLGDDQWSQRMKRKRESRNQPPTPDDDGPQPGSAPTA